MSVIKITEEQGGDLAELQYTQGDEQIAIDGHEYAFEGGEDNVDDHRWAVTHLYVYKREDGKLFGMKYDIGSTENQENGFVYSVPELYEVEAEEVTVTKYKAV